MLNPFKPLELIKAEVFTSLPKKFRNRSRTAWSDPNRQGAEVECFLEGPSFDREGNLWIVDIPFGRIFRISPKQEWDLVVQYDGWPNGLKFHKDGRAFITDYKPIVLVSYKLMMLVGCMLCVPRDRVLLVVFPVQPLQHYIVQTWIETLYLDRVTLRYQD